MKSCTNCGEVVENGEWFDLTHPVVPVTGAPNVTATVQEGLEELFQKRVEVQDTDGLCERCFHLLSVSVSMKRTSSNALEQFISISSNVHVKQLDRPLLYDHLSTEVCTKSMLQEGVNWYSVIADAAKSSVVCYGSSQAIEYINSIQDQINDFFSFCTENDKTNSTESIHTSGISVTNDNNTTDTSKETSKETRPNESQSNEFHQNKIQIFEPGSKEEVGSGNKINQIHDNFGPSKDTEGDDNLGNKEPCQVDGSDLGTSKPQEEDGFISMNTDKSEKGEMEQTNDDRENIKENIEFIADSIAPEDIEVNVSSAVTKRSNQLESFTDTAGNIDKGNNSEKSPDISYEDSIMENSVSIELTSSNNAHQNKRNLTNTNKKKQVDKTVEPVIKEQGSCTMPELYKEQEPVHNLSGRLNDREPDLSTVEKAIDRAGKKRLDQVICKLRDRQNSMEDVKLTNNIGSDMFDSGLVEEFETSGEITVCSDVNDISEIDIFGVNNEIECSTPLPSQEFKDIETNESDIIESSRNYDETKKLQNESIFTPPKISEAGNEDVEKTKEVPSKDIQITHNAEECFSPRKRLNYEEQVTPEKQSRNVGGNMMQKVIERCNSFTNELTPEKQQESKETSKSAVESYKKIIEEIKSKKMAHKGDKSDTSIKETSKKGDEQHIFESLTLDQFIAENSKFSVSDVLTSPKDGKSSSKISSNAERLARISRIKENVRARNSGKHGSSKIVQSSGMKMSEKSGCVETCNNGNLVMSPTKTTVKNYEALHIITSPEKISRKENGALNIVTSPTPSTIRDGRAVNVVVSPTENKEIYQPNKASETLDVSKSNEHAVGKSSNVITELADDSMKVSSASGTKSDILKSIDINTDVIDEIKTDNEDTSSIVTPSFPGEVGVTQASDIHGDMPNTELLNSPKDNCGKSPWSLKINIGNKPKPLKLKTKYGNIRKTLEGEFLEDLDNVKEPLSPEIVIEQMQQYFYSKSLKRKEKPLDEIRKEHLSVLTKDILENLQPVVYLVRLSEEQIEQCKQSSSTHKEIPKKIPRYQSKIKAADQQRNVPSKGQPVFTEKVQCEILHEGQTNKNVITINRFYSNKNTSQVGSSESMQNHDVNEKLSPVEPSGDQNRNLLESKIDMGYEDEDEETVVSFPDETDVSSFIEEGADVDQYFSDDEEDMFMPSLSEKEPADDVQKDLSVRSESDGNVCNNKYQAGSQDLTLKGSQDLTFAPKISSNNMMGVDNQTENSDGILISNKNVSVTEIDHGESVMEKDPGNKFKMEVESRILLASEEKSASNLSALKMTIIQDSAKVNRDLVSETENIVTEQGTVYNTSLAELEANHSTSVIEHETNDNTSVTELETIDNTPVTEPEINEYTSVTELEINKNTLVTELISNENTSVTEHETNNNTSVTEHETNDSTSVTELVTNDNTLVTQPEVNDTSVTEHETVDNTSLTEHETNDNTSVTEHETNDSTSVTELVTNDNTSVTQPEVNDNTSVTEHETIENTSVTEHDTNDNMSVTELVTNDNTLVTEPETNDNTSVTEPETNDNTSVTEVVTNEHTSVTEHETNDNTSVTEPETNKKTSVANETVTKPSVSENETVEKPSVSDDETFEEASVSENESIKKSSVSENETVEKSSVSENETVEKSSVSENETVEKTSVSDDDIFEETSVTEKETVEKTTVTDDESFENEKISVSENESIEKTIEKTSVSENETVEKSSLGENETIEKSFVTEDETLEKTSVSENESIKKTSVSENESIKKTSVSENETVEKSSLGETETIEKSLVSENETIEKSSVSENETVEKSSVSENETVEKTTVSEDETFEETSVSENETVEKSSLGETETIEKSLVSENETIEKSSVSENETVEKSSVSENETVEKTTVSEDETFEETSVSENETVEKSSLDETEPIEKSSVSENETIEKSSVTEDEMLEKTPVNENETVMNTSVTDKETIEKILITENISNKERRVRGNKTERETTLVTDKETLISNDTKLDENSKELISAQLNKPLIIKEMKDTDADVVKSGEMSSDVYTCSVCHKMYTDEFAFHFHRLNKHQSDNVVISDPVSSQDSVLHENRPSYRHHIRKCQVNVEKLPILEMKHKNRSNKRNKKSGVRIKLKDRKQRKTSKNKKFKIDTDLESNEFIEKDEGVGILRKNVEMQKRFRILKSSQWLDQHHNTLSDELNVDSDSQSEHSLNSERSKIFSGKKCKQTAMVKGITDDKKYTRTRSIRTRFGHQSAKRKKKSIKKSNENVFSESTGEPETEESDGSLRIKKSKHQDRSDHSEHIGVSKSNKTSSSHMRKFFIKTGNYSDISEEEFIPSTHVGKHGKIKDPYMLPVIHTNIPEQTELICSDKSDQGNDVSVPMATDLKHANTLSLKGAFEMKRTTTGSISKSDKIPSVKTRGRRKNEDKHTVSKETEIENHSLDTLGKSNNLDIGKHYIKTDETFTENAETHKYVAVTKDVGNIFENFESIAYPSLDTLNDSHTTASKPNTHKVNRDRESSILGSNLSLPHSESHTEAPSLPVVEETDMHINSYSDLNIKETKQGKLNVHEILPKSKFNEIDNEVENFNQEHTSKAPYSGTVVRKDVRSAVMDFPFKRPAPIAEKHNKSPDVDVKQRNNIAPETSPSPKRQNVMFVNLRSKKARELEQKKKEEEAKKKTRKQNVPFLFSSMFKKRKKPSVDTGVKSLQEHVPHYDIVPTPPKIIKLEEFDIIKQTDAELTNSQTNEETNNQQNDGPYSQIYDIHIDNQNMSGKLASEQNQVKLPVEQAPSCTYFFETDYTTQMSGSVVGLVEGDFMNSDADRLLQELESQSSLTQGDDRNEINSAGQVYNLDYTEQSDCVGPSDCATVNILGSISPDDSSTVDILGSPLTNNTTVDILGSVSLTASTTVDMFGSNEFDMQKSTNEINNLAFSKNKRLVVSLHKLSESDILKQSRSSSEESLPDLVTNNLSVKPLQCMLCGERYMSQQEVICHVVMAHDISQFDSKLKNYICHMDDDESTGNSSTNKENDEIKYIVESNTDKEKLIFHGGHLDADRNISSKQTTLKDEYTSEIPCIDAEIMSEDYIKEQSKPVTNPTNSLRRPHPSSLQENNQWKCNVCNLYFCLKIDVIQHIKMKHKNVSTMSDSYICEPLTVRIERIQSEHMETQKSYCPQPSQATLGKVVRSKDNKKKSKRKDTTEMLIISSKKGSIEPEPFQVPLSEPEENRNILSVKWHCKLCPKWYRLRKCCLQHVQKEHYIRGNWARFYFHNSQQVNSHPSMEICTSPHIDVNAYYFCIVCGRSYVKYEDISRHVRRNHAYIQECDRDKCIMNKLEGRKIVVACDVFTDLHVYTVGKKSARLVDKDFVREIFENCVIGDGEFKESDILFAQQLKWLLYENSMINLQHQEVEHLKYVNNNFDVHRIVFVEDFQWERGGISLSDSDESKTEETDSDKEMVNKPIIVANVASLSKCHKCNMTFADRISLDKHNLTHKVKVKFSCRLCNKYFQKIFFLLQHLEIKHSQSTSSYFQFVMEHDQTTAGGSGTDTGEEDADDNSSTQNSDHERMADIISSDDQDIDLGEVETTESRACFVCGKIFESRIAIFTHLKEKHMIHNRKCLTCRKTFVSRVELQKHFATYHDIDFAVDVSDQLARCYICDVVLENRAALKQHLPKHDGKGFNCNLCKMKYTSGSSLRFHKRTVHWNLEGTRSCKICDKIFTNIKGYEQHMLNHFYDYLGPLKCNKCDLVLKNKKLYNQHQASHEISTVCEICGKVCIDQNSLKHHIAIHDVCEKCNICGKLLNKYSLKNHMARVHSNRDKVPCHICGKIMSPSYIKFHVDEMHGKVKVHHNKKGRRDCNVCGKVFQRPGLLKQHMVVHTGERPYVCEVCGNDFGHKSALNTHYLVHKGYRPHKCRFCDESFWLISQCKTHMWNEHTYADPNLKHKCLHCDKRFKHVAGLRFHLDESHPEKVEGPKYYPCHKCNKEFKYRKNLRLHMPVCSENAGKRSRSYKTNDEQTDNIGTFQEIAHDPLQLSDNTQIIHSEDQMAAMELEQHYVLQEDAGDVTYQTIYIQSDPNQVYVQDVANQDQIVVQNENEELIVALPDDCGEYNVDFLSSTNDIIQDADIGYAEIVVQNQ